MMRFFYDRLYRNADGGGAGAGGSPNGGASGGGSSVNIGGGVTLVSSGAGGGAGNSGSGGGGDPPPAQTWYEPEYASLVQQKDWKSPNDALKGYSNLETLLGEKATAIVPPKADADANEWNKFYQKIGAPADPSGYKFNSEGLDPKAVETAKSLFQPAGLNDKQAEAVLKGYNDWASKSAEEADKTFMVNSGNEVADLQTEWGGKFDDTIELAKRATDIAIQKAGLKPDQLNLLERAIGTKTMLKMFAEFGTMMKEGVAPGGGDNQAFRSTPEFAKGEIERLRGSQEFQAKYNHPSPTVRQQAIDQMDKLYKQAYGDKPVV